MPLFLITVFSKGERADLSQKERNQLAAIAKALVDEHSGGALSRRVQR
jgi:hypothetical protein